MNSSGEIPETVMLASLYKRLESIEPLCRIIILDAELSAMLTFRGEPEQKVRLDYSKYPARIDINSGQSDGQIYVTVDGEVMHDVLRGKMTPGTAIARRELLLRGSPGHLARFIPMLDFGTMLYREHLADAGCDAYERKRSAPPLKEAIMSGRIFNGEPVPLVKMNFVEKLVSRIVNGAAYGLGYFIGVLRYRVFEKLSLFELLSSMAGGLEAATPKRGVGDKDG